MGIIYLHKKNKFIKIRVSEFDFNRLKILANLYTRGNVSKLLLDGTLNCPVRFVHMKKKKPFSRKKRTEDSAKRHRTYMRLYMRKYLPAYRARKKAAKEKQEKP